MGREPAAEVLTGICALATPMIEAEPTGSDKVVEACTWSCAGGTGAGAAEVAVEVTGEAAGKDVLFFALVAALAAAGVCKRM